MGTAQQENRCFGFAGRVAYVMGAAHPTDFCPCFSRAMIFQKRILSHISRHRIRNNEGQHVGWASPNKKTDVPVLLNVLLVLWAMPILRMCGFGMAQQKTYASIYGWRMCYNILIYHFFLDILRGWGSLLVIMLHNLLSPRKCTVEESMTAGTFFLRAGIAIAL